MVTTRATERSENTDSMAPRSSSVMGQNFGPRGIFGRVSPICSFASCFQVRLRASRMAIRTASGGSELSCASSKSCSKADS